MPRVTQTAIEIQALFDQQYDGDEAVNTGWDDLRVSANSTTVNGSNPPTDALFKDNGEEIAGTAYAISFLSNTLGNITIPDNVVYDTSLDWSMDFWIRPVVGTNNGEFFRKRDVFELDFAGGDLIKVDVKGGVGNANTNVQFNRGAWNHFTMTYNATSGDFIFYMNNIVALTFNGAVADSTRDFEINRSEILFDIDYITYWSEELTPAEVAARYNVGSGQQLQGNEVGLKSLWELNEGTGTTLIDKTGIGSDGSITSGTEGSAWDWIGGHVGNTSRGSRGVILKYFSPTIENELYFDIQFPHAWKEGSEIRPHVHWIPNSDEPEANDVRWGFEYTWANVSEVFPDTLLIYGNEKITVEDNVGNKHYITNLPAIDGTGKTLSSMMVCRIFRDADSVVDTYTDFAGFLEFDIHYQTDQERGSRDEFAK